MCVQLHHGKRGEGGCFSASSQRLSGTQGLVCMEKWAREMGCEEILATLVAQSLLLWAVGASECSAVFLS